MYKIKLMSLFSGIGAFEKSLYNNKIDFKLVGYSEINKYASKSYSLIHRVSEKLNLGDITKIDIDKLPDFNLMTWGFPCQDISIEGKGAGMVEGTRSNLYHEGMKILKVKRPTISIIENVKNLTGKKFKIQFEQILHDLIDLGYKNYWKVLNAKHYGIPQNRERVFIISVLDGREFEFNEPVELTLKLKDMLESEVDEKYYLNDNNLIWWNKNKLIVHEATKKGYSVAVEGDSINIQFPNSKTRRGRIGHEVAQTIETSCNQVTLIPGYKIRKLTPREYWRLMGFNDKDIDICIENGISNTQLYKQAGNSIVVNVLDTIFKNLYKRT